jgi:branched-chain amino acid transport system substrate-binding protein
MLVLLLSSMAAAGIREAAAAEKEMRIGVAVALSGIFGRDGTLVKEAYEAWADAVNAKGGMLIKGAHHPVRLTFYDDESSEVKTAQLVERLATSDKVDLILGGFGSNVVFAGSAVAEKYKYPYISGAGSANTIFDRGFKYVFGTLNKTFDEVKAAAEVFGAAQPKPKTAAVIGADHLFGKLSAEGFRKFATEQGMQVAHFEIFPMALTDYNSLLLKVKRQNADILLVGGLLPHALRVTRAAKEVEYTPKGMAFSYGPTVPDFIKELGKDAEGVIGASEWLASLPYKDPIFGSAQAFRDALMKKYGKEADYVQAAAAAGAIAQQHAVETLGLVPPLSEKDREAVMEQLHKQELQTLYGKVKFGKDGAIELKPPIAVQVQGGKLVMVYPREIEGLQSAKLVYPLAPWKTR